MPRGLGTGLTRAQKRNMKTIPSKASDPSTSPSSLAPHIQRANTLKAQNREYLNNVTEVTGDLHIERDEDGWITISLRDATFWDTRAQKNFNLTPNDPDKISVTCEDYELAVSEFNARWSAYTVRRFKHPVQYVVRNTYRS